MRSMVEGDVNALAARPDYLGDHAGDIIQDVTRRNPDDPHSLRRQPAIPTAIKGGPLRSVMRDTVDLDRKAGRGTEEIQDIIPNGVLSPELETSRS